MRIIGLLCALLALALASCEDSEEGGGTPEDAGGAAGARDVMAGDDATPGSDAGAGADAGPTSDTGPGQDTGPDADASPPPEPQTWSFWEEDDPCGPHPAVCGTGDDCAAEEACVNTACVGPVDPETYTFAPSWSAITRLQIPENVGVDGCCFDVTGDGEVDNRLGVLVTLAGELLPYGFNDFTGMTFQAAIESGRLAYLVEHVEVPEDGCGAARVWFWPGIPDIDGDGMPEQSYAARAAGEGTYRLLPGGIGPHGPSGQYNRAALDEEGILRAEGVTMTFGFVFPDGRMLELPAYDVRVEGAVVRDAQGLSSVDSGVDGAVVGGLRISGYTPMQDVIGHFDAQARRCACAGIEPDRPVIEYGVEGGAFVAECVQDVAGGEDACAGDGRWACEHIEDVCLVVPFIGGLGDVSTGSPGEDGTTGFDALSFGLLGSVAGATLADPRIAPAVIAATDRYFFHVDSGPQHLDVLANDHNALGPLVVGAVGDPGYGTADIGPHGESIVYAADEGFAGLDVFTYTLGEGANAQEGTIKVKVSKPLGGGYRVSTAADQFEAPLGRGPIVLDVLANDVVIQGDPEHLFIDGPNNLSPRGVGYLGATADRQQAIFNPTIPDFAPTTIEFGYGITAGGPVSYGGSRVTVHLVRPDSVCGDGIHDPWAEGCDDGNLVGGDGCDGTCALEACPGGGDPVPYHLDEDQDGFGAPHAPVYACAPVAERVANGEDCDDGNADANPDEHEFGVAICSDGFDNNCDGFPDCGDYPCQDTAACQEQACRDGADDDGDGLLDCADPDCAFRNECVERDCGNGLDDDEDGLADCFDADCFEQEPCAELGQETCGDGLDNDEDGQWDCDDPGCMWGPPCSEQGGCGNELDDDGDGLVDCEDPDCEWDWLCTEHDCANDLDDDGDGLVDCEDDNCRWTPDCQ